MNREETNALIQRIIKTQEEAQQTIKELKQELQNEIERREMAEKMLEEFRKTATEEVQNAFVAGQTQVINKLTTTTDDNNGGFQQEETKLVLTPKN